MSEPGDPKDSRVGVRELRQNLSIYLGRVKLGERLEVTEYGEPVALLVPLPPAGDSLAAMIADGRVIAAKGNLADWLRTHPPLPARPGQKPLTQILREMRDEEEF